jgi:hypothetical protein
MDIIIVKNFVLLFARIYFCFSQKFTFAFRKNLLMLLAKIYGNTKKSSPKNMEKFDFFFSLSLSLLLPQVSGK